MRTVRPLIGAFILAFSLLGIFAVGNVALAQAEPEDVLQTNAIDVETGYASIMSNGIIFANICPTPRPAEGQPDSCACRSEGKCSLDDVLQIFVNISIFILAISGSIILLMFVYGGFLWVTSRGDSNRVQRGKDTMSEAVIGFAIIMLSYSMINFLIASLAGDRPGATLEETIDNTDDGQSTLQNTQ